MVKRYLGNIITQNPTAPSGPFENDAAPGVWSLAEAFAYSKAGLWPIPGNVAPYALLGMTENPMRILIATLGNAVGWGDAYSRRSDTQACASSTRGVWAGGGDNVIQLVEFATSGSGADFGDLVYAKYTEGVGFGSNTRGIFAGGQGDPRDSIQYITIASTGNATVFGSLTSEDFTQGSGGFSSTTRGVLAESSNQNTNNIDYLTIASTGNSTNFGEYGSPLDRNDFCGASNSTRGLFAGGWDGSGSNYNVIDYVTIASTGNTTDFGDLTLSRRSLGGAASPTRAIFMGGSTGTIRNTIDYVEIASTGNAADFGDLDGSSFNHSGCSNSHGGIAA